MYWLEISNAFLVAVVGGLVREMIRQLRELPAPPPPARVAPTPEDCQCTHALCFHNEYGCHIALCACVGYVGPEPASEAEMQHFMNRPARKEER